MKQKGQSVLVAGGAGFIGSHVVDRLLEQQYRVTVLDNLVNGKMSNISHHHENPHFHFIKGSVLNHTLVNQTVKKCDYVINMSTLGVRHSIKYPFQN